MRFERQRVHAAAWAALIAFSLTALIYGSGVHLPYQSDDLLQVPWVAATGLREIWTEVGPYNDYRPLHFTVWKGTQAFTGYPNPLVLHTLNLIGHALCGTLVGVLVTYLKDDAAWWRSTLAAAGFTLFPFAYDNVLWVSALSYPLTLSLTLGALLCYLTARQRPRRHALGLGLIVLAGLAYEGGVVAGPAVVWMGLTFTRATVTDLRRHRWRWAYGLASLLPLLAVLRVASHVPSRFLQGLHPQYTPLTALQATVFPVAPLAQGFRVPLTGLLLLGLATLAALGLLAWRGQWWSRYVGSVGWIVLWSVIPLTTQAFNWFRDPPRVFYPAAVGIALLWTDIIDWLANHASTVAARTAVTLALGALTLVPAGRFLIDEVRLYRMAGDLIWDTVRAARDDETLLVVNLPDRLTRQPQTYPLGHEGVIPLPPPTGGDTLLAAHGRLDARLTIRGRGDLLPALPYRIDPVNPAVTPDDVRAADRVMLATYDVDGSALTLAGRVRAPTLAAPLATFSETLELLEVACHKSGDTVTLNATWRAAGPIAGQPTLFTHWLDVDGALVAQADGDPLAGLYPLNAWRTADVVQEHRRIDAAIGEGRVGLGVWDPSAGERWTAVDAVGQQLSEQTYRLTCSLPGVTP